MGGNGLRSIVVSALGNEGGEEQQEGQSAKDAANRVKPVPSFHEMHRFFRVQVQFPDLQSFVRRHDDNKRKGNNQKKK